MAKETQDLIWEKLKKGVFIVAEAGKNFIQTEEEQSPEVYLNNAFRLVDEAVKAGADAIKFQTHAGEDEQANIKVIAPHFKGTDRYNWVQRNIRATPVESFWKPLKDYCGQKGIIFFSTPESRQAAKLLNEEVGVDLWKIGSGDILDFVMLDYIRETGKPIIFASGMSTLEEVDKTIDFLKKRTDQIVIMHCVSIYPCPPEKLNLGTIEFLRERYGLLVGFSSHSTEWQSSVAAVNLGAIAIEKHFTLDRELWGSDHKVSLLPNEFRKMVESIRSGDKFDTGNYGERNKILHNEESEFRPFFRKSLVAADNLPSGTILEPEMVYAMRPQEHLGGLPSEKYNEVIGRRLLANLKKFEPFTLEIIQ